MGDPRVNGTSAYAAPHPTTLDDQMLDILNNPRMNENEKVAELEKSVANLPEQDKAALFERLKDRKSKDPLVQQFHYRLSHHSSKPGKMSTVNQVLNTLKPAAPQGTAPSQGATTGSAAKGSSPSVVDPKTADTLARNHFMQGDAATAATKPGTPVNVDASVLKPGESISAKLSTRTTPAYQETNFAFSRPVTKEQAAAIIFQKGKVPADVKLEQGAGNSWTIKVPNDFDSIHNAASHYNSHTETVVTRERTHEDLFYPKPDVSFSWVGGTLPAKNPRKDLKNDYGFVISKKYPLDEGQSPDMNVRTLVQKGPGFEVKFEKPMTKDQVMEKFFEKNVGPRQVRLIPDGPEPATTWQVQMLDGGTIAKRPAVYAFSDAITEAQESIPPGTPDGIRAHIENQTVPANARKFPPDVRVWEQDGYLVRVETNGKKGQDGYYNYDMTKLNPGDKKGNDTMRWLMLEKGLPVRKAWGEYITHWDKLHAGMLSMVGGAGRFMPRFGGIGEFEPSFREPAPRTRGGISEPVEIATPTAKPPVEPEVSGGSKTIESHPAPMPRPQAPKPPSTPEPAPVPPGQQTFGKGLKTENQTPGGPAPKVFVPGKGKTLPGSLTRKVGKSRGEPPVIASLPKKSGTKLTDQQVLEVHSIDSSRIGWSMSKAEHLRQWQAANPGTKEPPPTAFTTRDGRVQVSEEAWVQSGQPALWGMEQQ